MKREYEFRAWHLDRKEMSKPFYLNQTTMFVSILTEFDMSASGNNVELMQYIGTTDNSMKPIFDCDIIQFFDAENRATENGDDWTDTMSVGQVFWDETELCWDVTNKISVDRTDALFGETKIIGNIYQNPELL